MKISGIYQIQSKIKVERCYIGSAVNISHRWKYHLYQLKNHKHHSKKLQRHYDKYGEVDLHFSILLGCDKQDLIKCEQYFIDSYKPYFNNRIKADSNLGLKRDSAWNKGRKTSLVTIQKLKESHKGQRAWNKGLKNIYSDDTIDKMKNSLKGRKVWNKGLHYSNPKMKGNQNSKGRISSDEYKRKCRESALKRPPISEETREKIRKNSIGNKNMLGKIRSEETRKRVSEGLKKYNELKKLNKLDLITNN